MQEVEAVCDRVIIINRGEIVADRNMKELLELTTEINKTDKSKTAEQLDLEKIFHI